MGLVGYVPKRGFNDFHRYNYVMEADLVATIRPLLAAAGIMIIPNVVSEEWLQGVVPERNGTSSLCKVLVEYTVTDGNYTYMFRIPGYGVDKSDKSVYKAMTGSMKYALMKLFEVATGDDPEQDSAGHDVSITIEDSDQSALKGGKSAKATMYQLQRISATMREKQMDRIHLLQIIDETLGLELHISNDDDEAQQTIRHFLQDLSSEDAGKLVAAVENWSRDDGTEGYS